MSTPHCCPVCGGGRQIRNPDMYAYGHTAVPLTVPCPSCSGTGVVWETTIPPAPKTLDATSSKDFSEVEVFGNPDAWQLVCKASSKSQGWMESTKAMEIGGLGVLVQVSTQQGDHVAEAITFVPGTTITTDPVTGQLSLAPTALVAFANAQGQAAIEQLSNDPELAACLPSAASARKKKG